jgi:periplasmic copper chaperone A
VTTIKRAALAILLAACLPGLAACSGANEGETQASAAAGLTVSNARVVLAPVAGNPAAVYFDLSYSGAPGVTLTGVAVEGAGMTMIHDYAESKGTMTMIKAESVALTKGTPVTFAPGGLHVMALKPSATWKAGDKVNVTLTLSDGTSHTVAAAVRAAGEER